MLADCIIHMDTESAAGMPAMMTGLEPMKGEGIFLRNVKGVELHRVIIKNCTGQTVNGDDTAEFILS